MSERTSTGAFVNCSGLANAGVPTKPPCVSAIAFVFSATALATPKSITFTATQELVRRARRARRTASRDCGVPTITIPSSRPWVQPAFFRGSQGGGPMESDIESCQNVERPQAANPLLQRFAFDQFHCIKELTGFLANSELIHGRNIRVAQRSRGARFAHKTLARFCAVRSKISVDDF